MSSERSAELAGSLAAVRRRIHDACEAAGRHRDDVHLIAVTKTYPASDVERLAALGVTDVGENRHPEAAEKHAAVAAPLTWHFVGALQTNKASAVAAYADVVHSVDRPKLVAALDRGAAEHGRVLTCLVQVRLSDADGRAGVEPADASALADLIAASESLRIGGVMGVAPLGADPAPSFAILAAVAAEVAARHPGAVILSAGMSDDLEAAVAAGATHLRIGRALLGERPPLR